jgi:hypothetical protein
MTAGPGSLSGTAVFKTLPVPFIFGQAQPMTVGLLAEQSGNGYSDYYSTAELTGIEVFDASGGILNSFSIVSASGTHYSANGVVGTAPSSVPEPSAESLAFLGLLLFGTYAAGSKFTRNRHHLSDNTNGIRRAFKRKPQGSCYWSDGFDELSVKAKIQHPGRDTSYTGALGIFKMLTKLPVLLSLFVVLLSLPAAADSLVYVISVSHHFGKADLNTGAFTQIGPNTPEIQQGLVAGPDGSLLTLGSSGNLDSINPATGVTTVIGPTGLGNCSTPNSPCGPTSANDIVGFGGAIYATDYHNDLYNINASTGRATLIGATGIPAVPFPPFSPNPDGSFNYYDETLFGTGAKLYATFDAGTFNPVSGKENSLVAPALYQIDPSTAMATLVAPTVKDIAAAVVVNGTVYAFDFPSVSSQVLTLNVANGRTTLVTNFDPAAGIIDGAAFVPEPASIELVGLGVTAVLVCLRRRRARAAESSSTPVTTCDVSADLERSAEWD